MSSSVSPATDAGSSALPVDTAADMARAHDLAPAQSDASGNGYSSDAAPTYDQIAEAAYHRYLRRGGQHGRDFEDWVEAERELKNR